MRGLPPQRPNLNGGNRITESATSMHGFMVFFVAFGRLAAGRERWSEGYGLGVIWQVEARSKGHIWILA